MDFGAQPVDYASIIGQGQNLAGNPVAQQQANVSLQNSQIAGQQVQQQMAIQRLQLQRQMSFGTDLGNYVKNPTPEGLAGLFGRYPEFEKQAIDARGALDRGDITQLGSAAALASKGDYPGAAQIVQDRIDAEKKAGTDPAKIAQSQHVLDLLNSGDPQQQKGALGLLSLGVGIAVGPEKAAEFLKANGLSSEPVTLHQGDVLASPQGGILAKAPLPYDFKTLNTPSGGQQLYAVDQNTGQLVGGGGAGGGSAPASTEGGGQTSGAGQTTQPPVGVNAAISYVFSNEGGYNPKDANGSPTNFGINFKANQKELAAMGINASNFRNMTQQQAAQIYASKYWPKSGAATLAPNLQAPYFDAYVRSRAIAKQALAQSNGDPQRFVQIASAAFQKMASNPTSGTAPYAHAWANRDAKNAAIAAGAPVSAAGSPNIQGGAAPQAGPQPLASTAPQGALDTKGAEPGHAWNADHSAQIPVPGTDADPNAYSPQDIDTAARMWLPTGQFPTGAGGMGGGGQMTLGYKNAVIKRAMQIWQQSGHTSDQLQDMRRQYTSLSGALTQAQQNLTGLEAAEEGLKADANRVLEAHRVLADTAPNNPRGIGIVHDSGGIGGLVSTNFANNTRLDWYERHGDAATQAAIKNYKDAVNGFSATYSKFMSAGNGTGGSAAPSDASKASADELNDLGMGPTALRAHFQSVLAEAANKRMGYQRQVDMLNNKISGLTGTGGQQQQPQQSALPPGAKVIGTHNGKRVIEVNGQRMVEQ